MSMGGNPVLAASGVAADRGAETLRRGVGFLLRGCRRHPRLAAIAFTCAIVNGGCMVLGAKAIGWCTDHIVVAGFAHRGFGWGTGAVGVVFVLAVSVLRVLTIIGRTVATGTIQFRSTAAAREAVVAQYLRLGVSWHRRRGAGSLVSHAVSDTEMAWDPMQHFPFAVGMTAMLTLVMIDIAVADAWLAVIAIIVIPLVLAANLTYQRVLAPRAQRAQRQRAVLSALAHEAVEGRQVIGTLGITGQEIRRFEAAADELRAANLRVGRANAVFEPAIELLPPLAALVILAVGVGRIEGGHLGVGTLVEVVYLLITTAIPLNVLARFLGVLPLGVAGQTGLASTAAETERPAQGRCRPELSSSGSAVHLDSAAFGYTAARVVHDIALRIPPGGVVAVVGPTGAGKTTLLALMAHLLEADRGTIAIDGVDTRRLSAAALRDRAALVTQSAFLFGDTLRANITLGATADDSAVRRALRVAGADDFVAALPDGLDTVVSESAQLSGGQRQRIALARAVFRAPRLLLLDDTTSALDPLVEQTVVERLRAEYAGPHRRTTVVLVGHRAATITLADTVVYLDAGRIVAHGPHDELSATVPGYRELVGAYGRAETLQ
ncbi:putative ABC transporter, ATP-binding/membrane protein [Nocardia nova SH22a]|uniref:Putative ABC transporter, ATP-binding/membrane protein n=1 Tax=Nocardia nova SH22a TaxID=1415166 RepID=W5TFA7_9NOCA|nr:ABC transporter ATP-binding protein [Nocardia nova]AHH17844.1 putative ABC transporter, ATP-binding/membrane protein [Nocardia nova SH22a]